MQDGSFHELREMMTEAVKKCRLISSNLYPLHVVPGNMDHFVQRLSDMINRSPRPIQFSHSIDRTLAVSGETFTQLLYIASESVTNAIKHSDCSIIELKILRDDDRAVMTVSDNGIGMNSDELKSSQGCLGLKIMEYRASLMNWSIAISSSFNDGTSVLCTFR
jgi:nitrate/nitrite-specific signal transduction histidine kinase